MDFAISAKTEQLLSAIRDFMTLEVQPLEADYLAKPFRELFPALGEKRRMVKERGWWTPHLPATHGGMGLGLVEQALVGEQLGRSPLGHYVFNSQAPDAGNMELMMEFGTQEQQKRWFEPLARGEIRSCFAMTEPERPGSNPVWMETTAVRRGQGYVINGRKWFVTGADGAEFAIVMAVTDADADPHRRAGMLIVPTDTPGYRLVRNISHMGHTGEDWPSHGEVALEDCHVPEENLLGAEGAGFAMAQARLGPGRIYHTMRWIGICERAFEIMCRRAATRELAPGELLGTRESVQGWIAESRAEIDASRLLVLRAAWNMDKLGTRAVRSEISLIKFWVARVLLYVIDRAIQVNGALGVSDDLLLSTFYRNERAARIYDGPDEVHKKVVARHVLKEYGVTIK